MSWLSSNAVEISAIGSICMDFFTLIVIIFNINQFSLSRRSLNIDINFRLFELRKSICKKIEDLIEQLQDNKSFESFLEEKNGIASNNNYFEEITSQIDDSRYLFSKEDSKELDLLLFVLSRGTSLEKQIQDIKNQSPESWGPEETSKLQELTKHKKEVLEHLNDVNLKTLSNYLNVAKFSDNLMQDEKNAIFSGWLRRFNLLNIAKHFKAKSFFSSSKEQARV